MDVAGVQRPFDIPVVVTAVPVTLHLPHGEVLEFDEVDNVRNFSYPIF